jgi:CHAT domain-containing protein/tetratricopeptide (TPR) repeat protein
MLGLAWALLGLTLPGAEPVSKPPWQRSLQGEDARTAQQHTQRLEQARQAGEFDDALKEATALAQLREKVQGGDHWEAADARAEVEALRRVLRQEKEVRAEYAGIFALQREGSKLFQQGRFNEAQPLLAKVLAVRQRVLGEDHPDTAQSYSNLASSLNAQGKYAEAEAVYRKALDICRKALGEEHPTTAKNYNNLAANLNAQGKYREAEAIFRKALAIRRKVLGEEHPDTAQGYDNLASNLQAQGRYPEAEAGYRKALDVRRRLLGEEHPDTAISYNNVAFNLQAQGKYKEAEDIYRRALDVFRKVLGEEHPLTATCYNNLATNLNAQGKHAEAEAGLRKALEVRRKVLGDGHPDTAQSYSNVAVNLDAQGKSAEAEALFRRALDVYRRTLGDSHPYTVQGYRHLAANMNAQGKYAEAEALWSRAADLGGRSRPRGDAATLQALAAVLARNGKPEDAWRRFEESLGRGTWGDLSARLRRPAAGEPSTAPVSDRKAIQDAMPADVALISWLDLPAPRGASDPGGEHSAVLLRSTGAPIMVRLSGSGAGGAWTTDDTRLPAQLRTALQSPDGDWRPLARRLHRQRLAPLAKDLAAGNGLPAVRHLVVLPSTALAGVPIEMFADGYTVSYASSATLYAHLRKQPPVKTSGLLAVGDPVVEALTKPGGTDKWPPLPSTRVEVEALRRLFGEQATVLTDSDASEQRLDETPLARYRYLHLATHSQLDSRSSLGSALILSGDKLPDPAKQVAAGLPVYDGRLTAEEVLRRWRLNCDLVTLSASETALGKYEQGEGFLGFAQALTVCGSRSACLSLWKVDPGATPLLMDRFYQNLLGKRGGLKDQMPKAAALREAKEWLRKLSREEAVKRAAELTKGVERGKERSMLPLLPKIPPAPDTKEDPPYAHPYYWAAFVLIGDPD